MRVCSKCGTENQPEFVYCMRCGASLGTDTGAALGRDETELEDAGKRVVRAIHARDRSDRRISPWWTGIAVLPVAGVAGSAVLLVLIWIFAILSIDIDDYIEGVSGLSLVFLVLTVGRLVLTAVFGVLFAILTFKMIDRLNRHMEREERLRAALMAFTRREAVRAGGEQGVINELLRLSAFDGQAMVYEKKMAAMPWAFGMFLVWGLGSIAMLVPYSIVFSNDISFWFDELWFAIYVVGSIFGYIMQVLAPVLTAVLASHWMRTITTHEARWYGFANATVVAARRLGLQIGQAEPEPPPKERSFVLYLVLTVVTLGVFAIYWLYVLIKDPNEHLMRQRRFEDGLLMAVEG